MRLFIIFFYRYIVPTEQEVRSEFLKLFLNSFQKFLKQQSCRAICKLAHYADLQIHFLILTLTYLKIEISTLKKIPNPKLTNQF